MSTAQLGYGIGRFGYGGYGNGGVPPTADFTISPSDPLTGEEVTFDGSLSSDPDFTVVSFTWDFGDGTTAGGERVTHTYSESGSYTVELAVEDTHGFVSSKTTTLSVGEGTSGTPQPSLSTDISNPDIDQVVIFDAAGSSDPDGTIVSYEWNMGDGTTLFGSQVSHAYASGGVYTVTLTVTDNDGNTAQTQTIVSVQGEEPSGGGGISSRQALLIGAAGLAVARELLE